MKRLQVVQIQISDLLEWAACSSEIGVRPSFAEALNYYFNWAVMRKWELKAVLGGLGLPASQFAVVWEGEDTEGSADFLPDLVAVRELGDQLERAGAEADAAFIAEVCEVLEDRGWKLDEEKDGYLKADKLIAGEQLRAMRMPPMSLRKASHVVADQLEAGAWRAR